MESEILNVILQQPVHLRLMIVRAQVHESPKKATELAIQSVMLRYATSTVATELTNASSLVPRFEIMVIVTSSAI